MSSFTQQLRFLATPFGVALLLGLFLPIGCLLWFMLNAAEAERIATENRFKALITRELEHNITQWQNSFTPPTDFAIAHQNQHFEQAAKQPLATAAMISDAQGTIIFPTSNAINPPLPEDIHSLISQISLAYGETNDINARDSLTRALTEEKLTALPKDQNIALNFHLWKTLIQAPSNEKSAHTHAIASRLIALLNNYDDDLPARTRLMYINKMLAVANDESRFLHRTFLTTTLKFYESLNTSNVHTFLASPYAEQWVVTPYPISKNSQDKSPTIDTDTVWLIRNIATVKENLQHQLADKIDAGLITLEFATRPPLHPETIAYHTPLAIDEKWHVTIYWGDQNTLTQTYSRKSLLYFVMGTSVIIFLCASAIYVFIHIRREKHLSQLKSHAISTVAHELKTPLTSIRLLLDNLANNTDRPALIRDYTQIMQREHSRLSRLVDNFLTFNRLERKQNQLNLVRTDINELINDVLTLIAEKIESNRIDLAFHPSELPKILVDTNLMSTCLLNLIDNACKYARAPKKVIITTYQKEGKVVVDVADNGAGVASHEKKKIFEAYYRSDSALSRATEGTGLGLYIANAIVHMHQGTITVNDVKTGGSLFTVCLSMHHPKIIGPQ